MKMSKEDERFGLWEEKLINGLDLPKKYKEQLKQKKMSKELTKEEIIGKQFNLDLGSSSPVSVIVKDIKQDKVIVEYLYSTPGRTEEFTLSNFEYLAYIEINQNKDE